MFNRNGRLEYWMTGRTGLRIIVFIFSCYGMSVSDMNIAVAGEASGKSQQPSSQQPSSVNPDKAPEKKKIAPVLGGGIRKPPDIGAGGVATPTPPVETQSPTNEPDIVPPASPGLPQPSDSTIPPLNEGEPPVGSPSDQHEPLGQPDFLGK